MLDIAWTEMLVVAVVAIIVIGPKELPFALRAIGRWVGKARSLAREFQSSVDDMIAETELQELRETAKSIQDFDPDDFVSNQMDPTGGKSDEIDHHIDATDEEIDEYEAEQARKAEVDVNEDFTPPTEDDLEEASEPERSKEG